MTSIGLSVFQDCAQKEAFGEDIWVIMFLLFWLEPCTVAKPPAEKDYATPDTG